LVVVVVVVIVVDDDDDDDGELLRNVNAAPMALLRRHLRDLHKRVIATRAVGHEGKLTELSFTRWRSDPRMLAISWNVRKCI